MIGCARAASQRQLILLADERRGTTAGAQSYTLPSGTQYIDIELYGGGGGGAAGREFTSGRVVYFASGGGGGGGAYVRHGYTGARGNDVLNFVIGSAGTGGTFQLGIDRPGISGGNTSLTSLVRGSATIESFTTIIAHGGSGGSNTTSTTQGGRGGTGGVASGGNITNRNGNIGISGGVVNSSIILTVNGGRGASGGQNDANLSPGVNNGGTGGVGNGFSPGDATRAGVGGNGISDLIGAGGGGGGGYPGLDAQGSDSVRGSTGGVGGIRIRAYG